MLRTVVIVTLTLFVLVLAAAGLQYVYVLHELESGNNPFVLGDLD